MKAADVMVSAVISVRPNARVEEVAFSPTASAPCPASTSRTSSLES